MGTETNFVTTYRSFSVNHSGLLQRVQGRRHEWTEVKPQLRQILQETFTRNKIPFFVTEASDALLISFGHDVPTDGFVQVMTTPAAILGLDPNSGLIFEGHLEPYADNHQEPLVREVKINKRHEPASLRKEIWNVLERFVRFLEKLDAALEKGKDTVGFHRATEAGESSI